MTQRLWSPRPDNFDRFAVFRVYFGDFKDVERVVVNLFFVFSSMFSSREFPWNMEELEVAASESAVGDSVGQSNLLHRSSL